MQLLEKQGLMPWGCQSGILEAFSLSHGVIDPEEGNCMRPPLYGLRDSWI